MTSAREFSNPKLLLKPPRSILPPHIAMRPLVAKQFLNLDSNVKISSSPAKFLLELSATRIRKLKLKRL
jgi:hypothetical protein